MNDSDFDKFIRESAKTDLDVPDGLNWEQMNIPLPEKKKKRRPFFLLFIGFGVLICSVLFGIYFSQSKDAISKKIEPIAPSTLSNKNNTTPTSDQLTIQEATANESINEVRNSSLEKQINKPKINEKNVVNSDIKRKASNPLQTNKYKANTLQTSSIDKDATLKNESLKPTDIGMPGTQTESIKMPAFDKPKNEALSEIFAQINTLNIKPFSDNVEPFVAKLPPLTDNNLLNNDKEKNKLFSVSLSYGVNQSDLMFDNAENDISALKAASQKSFGDQISVDLKYSFFKQNFITAGVRYQKLFSEFMANEDLGAGFNSATNQIVYKNRRVFHNNNFQYIALNAGIGTKLYISKNFGSELSLNFSPNYRIKSSGRLLDEELSIITIEEQQADAKLFFNAGASANLFVKMKNNYFFIGCSFDRTLTDTKVLTNSQLTIKPQILSLNIGLSRGL